MSSSTKPDFAQKLLSDLRLRKERMANASSSHTSTIISQDAYGSGRRTPKTTTEMISLAKVSSKQRFSNGGSQSSRMSMEAASNQIVPYGAAQNTKQQPPLDLSMTLSYALDDAGKLKNMNLTGSNAMIGLLHQISRRSIEFPYADRKTTSRMQWPSNSQFPTLTNIHIKEISKGAQKINQILRTFSDGVNGNRGSVDIGKELLKGALDLEESLRMLVSLQEASDYTIVPQKKSRVKLLEMNEDDQNNADKSDDKHVERPVFSFDRRSKNTKSNEAPDIRVSSQSKPKRISNVVAKLMGLDQVQQNAGRCTSTGGQSRSNQGMEMRVGFARSDEFRDVGGWSVGYQSGEKVDTGRDKIVILTSKKEAETVDGYGYKARARERKSTWSEREREEMMTHITELSKRSGSKEDLRGVGSIKEQGLRKKDSGVTRKNGSNDEEKRARVVAEKSNENGHQKRNVKKLPVGPQHQNRPQRSELQRKKPTLEPRNGKKAQSKSPAKKMEESGPVVPSENSLKDIHEVKDEEAEGMVDKEMVVVKESSSDRGRKIREHEVKMEEGSPVVSSDGRVCGGTVQKVKNNSKMAKDGPTQKANEVMAKAMKAGSRPSRAVKHQTTILQRLRQRQPVKKGTQSTDVIKSEATDKPPSSIANEEELEKVPGVHSGIQEVNLIPPCDQLQDPETNPSPVELIRVSDKANIRYHTHQQKENLPKLTEEEICLKQTLITSQALLSTAEAIFKLNIPIGILYPSDPTSEEKGSKLITDCALELLKVKGRRRELVLSPRMRCLDDLVRHLHADLEALRAYTWKAESDPAECLLKMIERDVCHVGADVNCMWDAGWKKPEAETDQVIRGVEKCLLNELLDEVLGGFMEKSCSTRVAWRV